MFVNNLKLNVRIYENTSTYISSIVEYILLFSYNTHGSSAEPLMKESNWIIAWLVIYSIAYVLKTSQKCRFEKRILDSIDTCAYIASIMLRNILLGGEYFTDNRTFERCFYTYNKYILLVSLCRRWNSYILNFCYQ